MSHGVYVWKTNAINLKIHVSLFPFSFNKAIGKTMCRGSLAAYPLFQPKFLSVYSCHYQRKIAPKNMLTLQNNLICIPSDKSATSPTTHKLSTLSRKALIASKAIRINTFTVKSPLVDPLNNAVPCTEAVMGPLLPNQILVLLMAATYQKQILASGERGTFSKLKTLYSSCLLSVKSIYWILGFCSNVFSSSPEARKGSFSPLIDDGQRGAPKLINTTPWQSLNEKARMPHGRHH